MKLMIDIPEEYLKTIKAIPDETSSFDMLLIKYGTPFDSVIKNIKAEIIAELDNRPSFEFDEWTAGFNDGIRTALDIIDKHIGKEN